MGNMVAVTTAIDATIVATPATVVAIIIAIPNAGDQIVIKDGGSGGAIKATFVSGAAEMYIPIEITCATDIYADITGTATYTVIYKP